MPLLERGFDGAHVDLWVPILKLTFTAIALGTGFALWWRVLPEPSTPQLTGLGLYGAFMLLLILSRKV